MLFLSIVIPAYNSQKTILPLLDSIADSRGVRFEEIEIIVVDDKSSDNTVEEISNIKNSRLSGIHDAVMRKNLQTASGQISKTHIKIIKLHRNQGPAAARNIGVKYAGGRVILFLDSDVIVYKNTLYEIIRSFKKDPDLYALTGVWDKKQNSRKFFPKFKALRDWSYWINERDPRNYYYLFSTRIAAIKKELFLRLGGFDTTYKAALVEDIELTYRIARRYAVVFNPKVIVHHEFEDFAPIAQKYFWRSFYWSKIYRERRKFDPVATTGKEALTTISAGGLVGSLLLLTGIKGIWGISGIRGIFGLGRGEIDYWFFVICCLLSVIHLWGVRKFLWFCVKEEGLWFAVRAFLVGIALYLVILGGAVASILWCDRRLGQRDGGSKRGKVD